LRISGSPLLERQGPGSVSGLLLPGCILAAVEDGHPAEVLADY